MSSHHFVKEGQEAALVIVDALPYASIAPVLEWSPLVIVFGRALEDVLLWSIKIDIVICLPSEREAFAVRLEEQFPVEIITAEDWSFATEAMVKLLIEANHHSVVISTRNLKDARAKLESVAKLRVSIISEDGLKWSLFPSGVFEKWMAKGDELHAEGSLLEKVHATQEGNRLIADSDGVVRLTGQGAFWIGETF